MIVFFVVFTMFHKNRLEVHQNRVGAEKRFARDGGKGLWNIDAFLVTKRLLFIKIIYFHTFEWHLF